jgi:stage III sporulation protein AE
MSGVLAAVCSAGAINPYMKLQGIGRTLSRAITMLMAFVAGIFVAVLSVRGVIAGAADSVTIRGFRFLIGNTVPVVGSAIGEALNSVVAGIGLIKSTAGMLGIIGIVVINLPVLTNIILWKGALFVMGTASDITGNGEIKDFTENLSAVISLLTGALCFVSLVFILSIAIILTVSRA